MVTSVAKGGTQKLPKNIRLLKDIDMTIHWKCLEEHFMMVPLVFRFNHFRGKIHFLTFSRTHLSLKSYLMLMSQFHPKKSQVCNESYFYDIHRFQYSQFLITIAGGSGVMIMHRVAKGIIFANYSPQLHYSTRQRIFLLL
jgi:hypothetical protein